MDRYIHYLDHGGIRFPAQKLFLGIFTHIPSTKAIPWPYSLALLHI